ncbi:hypothetical protein [Piscibacillus halophilus]|uniref:hypothetical protein n=1 Tax=Piscibacillus halophilus TaxID=571933 RepID=UPI001C3773C2|nr:hypothetical protein [Piscibacillus halophilus]
MKKNYFIVLGNGFTIDFLKNIDVKEEIDVVNLFSQGDQVPFPQDNEPGFLSYKRCPNLWNLGARAYMDNESSKSLIDDIITCANIAHSAKSRHFNSTFIKAYQELSTYLKYLFVYYNNKITNDDIKNKLNNWGWLDFFKRISDSEKCSNIVIITYNYDIWLERILINHNINFEVVGAQGGIYNPEKDYKIKIIKPHGSISFTYADPIEPSRFKISSKERDLINGKIEDYTVEYNNLNNIYMFNAIIPPAGDSARLAPQDNWSSTLRNIAIEEARNINYGDEFIMCGLSYGHVDRIEIDSILTSLNAEVNVKIINPKPSNTINAVLNGLFENTIIYKNSEILGGLYHE